MKLAKQLTHEYDVSFWYGFSVLVPNDWRFASSDHSNVFQIHAGSGPGSSPVVGIRVGDAGNWTITSERDGTPTNQTTDTLAELPLQKGIWNDFVMHAIWSSQDDGVLELCSTARRWSTSRLGAPSTPTPRRRNQPLRSTSSSDTTASTRAACSITTLRVAKGTGDLSALVAPPCGAPDAGPPDDGGGPADSGASDATSGGAGGTSGGAGGTSGNATATGGAAASASGDDSGCGCRATGRGGSHVAQVLLVLAAALVARLRPSRARNMRR